MDFLAVHGDFPRCLRAKPDLVAFDAKHNDLDVIANADRLAHTPRQNKHRCRYRLMDPSRRIVRAQTVKALAYSWGAIGRQNAPNFVTVARRIVIGRTEP